MDYVVALNQRRLSLCPIPGYHEVAARERLLALASTLILSVDFQLVKLVFLLFNFPLLVLKGICHCWTHFLFFPGDSQQVEVWGA